MLETAATELNNRKEKMKRYVLTGAPSCGKTSLLLELESRGIPVIREAAEDVARLEMSKGVENPFAESNFQDKVLKIQMFREHYAPNVTTIIDRGVVDGLAYADKFHPARWWIEHATKERRYDGVFFLEPLEKMEQTAIRRETVEESLVLSEKLYAAYIDTGYEPIRIPVMSIEARAQMILECIV